MKLFLDIIKSLDTPDDQGRDWYAWACNQCSHAFLGVIVALYFQGAPLQVAAIIALLKETIDITRVPTLRTVRDSVVDVTFWVLGAWVASVGDYLTVAVILTAFALICGIIPRARKAVRRG